MALQPGCEVVADRPPGFGVAAFAVAVCDSKGNFRWPFGHRTTSGGLQRQWQHEAGSTGLEPEPLEKVVRQPGLLDALHRQSSARRRISRVETIDMM